MIAVIISGLILALGITECKASQQLYGDGHMQYTWDQAYDKCRNLNKHLATDTIDPINDDKFMQEPLRAWIGKLKLLSKWMNIVGCGDTRNYKMFLSEVESEGICELKCRNFKYFASDAMTDRDYKSCICLTQLPDLFPNPKNCFSTNSNTYMTVYERFNHSVANEIGNGNCMFNSCQANDPLRAPTITSCDSRGTVHGVCDDGESLGNWYFNWTESLRSCVYKHEKYFIFNLKDHCGKTTGATWTRSFRQVITASILNTGIIDFKPIKCAAFGYQSQTPDLIYLDCDKTLPYFICSTGSTTTKHSSDTNVPRYTTRKSDVVTRNTTTRHPSDSNAPRYTTRKSDIVTNVVSRKTRHSTTAHTDIGQHAVNGLSNNRLTTEQITYTEVVNKMQQKKSEEHKLTTGLIIGLVVGVLLVIAVICILIFIYKKRHSAETKHKSGTKRHFRNESYNHAFADTNSTNETHNLQLNLEDSSGNANHEYAVVQKAKHIKDEKAEKVVKISYESSNDDYDHLNEEDKKKIRLSENTYDSNVGIRSYSDPTYDTSKSTTRMTDNEHGVYDHFSQTSDERIDDNY